jgi:proteic killer suppression protein
MIKTFEHNGLKAFDKTGSRADVGADHAAKLKRQLARPDSAAGTQDMNVPGWKLHPLSRELAGHYAVSVNGNWRMTFRFEGTDAILVDYQDYH